MKYGDGSTPTMGHVPEGMDMDIHKSQLFECEQKATRVLTCTHTFPIKMGQ